MQTTSKNSCYVLLAALFACGGDADAETIRAAVERAARTHLLDLAATAALGKPSVKFAHVAPDAEIPCSHAARITAVDTRSPSRMRFAAECDAPASRTEVVVRASVTAEVVVAAYDLRANAPLDATALTIERRAIHSVADAISDPAEVIGKSTRRALRRGQPLSRRALIEPILVKRGADVSIVARNVGVEVTVAAEALEAGRRDEVVRVRNKANGQVIRARVVAAAVVEPIEAASESR